MSATFLWLFGLSSTARRMCPRASPKARRYMVRRTPYLARAGDRERNGHLPYRGRVIREWVL
jgi:hypothetical protein